MVPIYAPNTHISCPKTKQPQRTLARDEHPITGLMNEANARWQEYEDSRSTNFRQTVAKYRQTYGRHPPPGFKEWYQFARKKNVHNVDDFQQIIGDLRPFWALSPTEIRQMAARLQESPGIAGVRIRDHKVVSHSEGWRVETLAAAVEKLLGARLTSGLVIAKYGHVTARLKKLTVVECGHPVPDRAGLAAAAQVLALLRELNARDLLIVAISGGASALLPAPAEPITLGEKRELTDLLLRAGADIFELNTVRKHLSFLKGGQLAAWAYPATVVSLLLSDVIGDSMEVIGSGPTAPDPSTFAEALHILNRYHLEERVPRPVLQRLEEGAAGLLPEVTKFFVRSRL